MKEIDLSNAPILEYDEDSAELAKDYFFSLNKKPFHLFDGVREKGVNKCIIFYPRSFTDCEEIYNKCEKIYDFLSASSVSPVYLYDNKLLIALCPLGGPASANLIEELSYNGINTFIACGSCGCLVDGIDIGNELFIPTSAIRDEGLSYHYLPASRMVDTNAEVNKAIEKSLKKYKQKYKTGVTWTIDALYRETPNRTSRRIGEGAIGVEMECASLAAVCKYNSIKFGQLLYFTDKIAKNKWEWRLYDKIALRTHVLKICIDAIMSL